MGCWYFNCCDWKKITEFILKKRIPLKSIVSKLYDLDDVDETFRLFDSGRTQKIVRPSILYFKVSIWRGGKPFRRPARVPAVHAAVRVARTRRAGGAHERAPRKHTEMAPPAVASAHAAGAPRPVRQTRAHAGGSAPFGAEIDAFRRELSAEGA